MESKFKIVVGPCIEFYCNHGDLHVMAIHGDDRVIVFDSGDNKKFECKVEFKDRRHIFTILNINKEDAIQPNSSSWEPRYAKVWSDAYEFLMAHVAEQELLTE